MLWDTINFFFIISKCFCYFCHQVLQLFPYFTTHIIIEDLLNTRSVDLTIDNILEGRLVAPQQFIEEEPVVFESTPTVNTIEQFINMPTSNR